MKKRLRKKLLKKQLRGSATATQQSAPPLEPLKAIAIECWRIKKLLPEFSTNKKQPVLVSSVEKALEALEASGVEVEDPAGMEFRDGLTLEVALFEDNPALTRGTRRISETLSPTVYINGKLVRPATVIVAVGTGESI